MKAVVILLAFVVLTRAPLPARAADESRATDFGHSVTNFFARLFGRS